MSTSISPDQRLAEADVARLSTALHHHNYRYYAQDDPDISDGEYDQLLRQLQELEARFPHLKRDTSPSQRVGSAPDVV